MLTVSAQNSDIPVNTSPNINAFFGLILPDGMGLPFVLSIIASISRSLYPVRASAAAEPAATPIKSMAHVKGERKSLNKKAAVTADPRVVKTSKYQIFGFVSS